MAEETRWQPFAEPWHATALRTGAVALAVGVLIGVVRRQLSLVPLFTLLALWFTLGGHFLELAFRNQLRRHITTPATAKAARLAYWFAGGSALYAGALATRVLFTGSAAGWPWWVGGVGFVGLELFLHLLMHTRRIPNFYDGRG